MEAFPDEGRQTKLNHQTDGNVDAAATMASAKIHATRKSALTVLVQ
jgi:hypothetical protein